MTSPAVLLAGSLAPAVRFMDGLDLYGSISATPDNWQNTRGTIRINQGAGRFGGDALECDEFDGILRIDHDFTLTDRVVFQSHVYQDTNTGGGNRQTVLVLAETSGSSSNNGSAIESGQIVAITNDGDTNTTLITDAAGTQWDISASWPAVGTWFYLEVGVDIGSTIASIIVRIDENEVLNVTGDTSSVADFNRLAFGSGNHPAFTRWDDPIIVDYPTGDTSFLGQKRIATLKPNANGSTIQFASSTVDDNYQNVDEQYSDGTTSLNRSQTVGNRDLFSFEDILDTIGTIEAVQLRSVAKGTGNSSVSNILKPGGASNVTVGKKNAISIEFVTYKTIWLKNPETLAKWLDTEVQNIEAGYEHK